MGKDRSRYKALDNSSRTDEALFNADASEATLVHTDKNEISEPIISQIILLSARIL